MEVEVPQRRSQRATTRATRKKIEASVAADSENINSIVSSSSKTDSTVKKKEAAVKRGGKKGRPSKKTATKGKKGGKDAVQDDGNKAVNIADTINDEEDILKAKMDTIVEEEEEVDIVEIEDPKPNLASSPEMPSTVEEVAQAAAPENNENGKTSDHLEELRENQDNISAEGIHKPDSNDNPRASGDKGSPSPIGGENEERHIDEESNGEFVNVSPDETQHADSSMAPEKMHPANVKKQPELREHPENRNEAKAGSPTVSGKAHNAVEISTMTRNDLQEEAVDDTAPNPAPAVPESKGFAANLVSSLKTFLPSKQTTSTEGESTPKKSAKIRALEAAEEAKKKEEEKAMERARQKAEIERIKQERLRAKAEAEREEARKKQELQIKKEQEAAARRRAREEAERREKEEKARRLEEHKKRRKLEAEAAARGYDGTSGNENNASFIGGSKSLAEAKERLAKIQQQAALLQHKPSSKFGQSTKSMQEVKAQGQNENNPSTAPVKMECDPSSAPSYEISPYKSDFESDEEAPKKPVPDWARGKVLIGQLVAQMYIDPDEVFQQHAKTCSLDEVFASCHKSGKGDFSRRTSSGNWIEDRVTWKEELGYKKAMGYI